MRGRDVRGTGCVRFFVVLSYRRVFLGGLAVEWKFFEMEELFRVDLVVGSIRVFCFLVGSCRGVKLSRGGSWRGFFFLF